MPTAPPSLCVVSGCPNKVAYGRCDEHRLEARRDSDARRPSAARRGYDRGWRTVRDDYLDGHPYCEHPACAALPVWRRTIATDVDHIDGLGPDGPGGNDPSNLQALCHPHHSEKTATHDGGFGRSRR